jgi:hypothetical protein
LYLPPVPGVGSRFQCIGQQRFLSGEKAMFMTIGVANTAVFERSLNAGTTTQNDPNLQPAPTEYLMRDGLTHGCASTEQQRSAP